MRRSWLCSPVLSMRVLTLIAGLLAVLGPVAAAEGSDATAAVQTDGRRFIVSAKVSEAYTYSKAHGGAYVVESPPPFLPAYVVDSVSLGIALTNPQHITAGGQGQLFIVNTGANNILVTDTRFRLQRTITGFQQDGKAETFNQPEGCYVAGDGALYVADTGNKRLVILNADGTLKQIIARPESDVLADDFVFAPQKVAVDESGRIFVVAKGSYEGILQFYGDGSFLGFIGSIPVQASFIDILWKRILSQEQKSKVVQFIPVTYTNVFLDYQGFLFTTSLSTANTNPIRRLNPGGTDILIRKSLAEIDVMGDVIGVQSRITAICSDENGIYYAADSGKGRLFAYDEDGNLLCAFGGPLTGQVGSFDSIASVMLLDGDLLVLDSKTGMLTAMRPTSYMTEIQQGLAAYRTGWYDDSWASWEAVVAKNANFDLAYSKMGMIEHRRGNYSQAMKLFKNAYDREHYSDAYVQYRMGWYSRNLPVIITVLVLLVTGIAVLLGWRRRRRRI